MIKLLLPILIPLCELEKFNESLVKRGELLPDIDIIDNLFDIIDNLYIELEKINKNKEGSLCIQIHLFIKLLRYVRVYFHLQYRQTDIRCSMRTCFQHIAINSRL